MNSEKEMICGFEVSEKRKAVWRTELDMVKIFVGICHEFGLQYVVSGGTLIGAVRHSGFIPWDDDIDIMMPRADYERFLSVACDRLGDGYFLQCSATEKNYCSGHAQIRNNKTACLREGEYDLLKRGEHNCGIFIDIFPYDYVDDDFAIRNKHAKKIAKLRKLCEMKIFPRSKSFLKSLIKKFICGFYFMFHSLEKTIEKINELCRTATNGRETDTVALISFAPCYEKNVWKKQWFEETVEVDFEDMKVAAPKYMHEVLAHEFGDYMQIPENKEDGSMHGKCFFDTENSYEKYRSYTREQIATLCRQAKL